MLKLKSKAVSDPSQGYNEWCPKKVKKTFVGRMSSAELAAACVVRPFQRVKHFPRWEIQPPSKPARRQPESSTSQQQGEKPARRSIRSSDGREINS